MNDHFSSSDRRVQSCQPIAWCDIQSRGLLRQRLERNFDRLEAEKYRPENVFLTNEQCNWWPGDVEGRTILGLVLLAQATGRTPRFLDAILERLPGKLNARGYFGDICPEGTADEQQLSSHGWVLRALCEYYLWKRNPVTLEQIRRMIGNLALPLSGHYYPTYPIRPEDRVHCGGALGERTIVEIAGRTFYLSSDIGCAFIFMDGVSQAYAIDPTPEVKALIDEMVARFLQIDLEAIKAQTHSTLTTLRAFLRWYELTGTPELLEAVIERFALYKHSAMSENYENWNWFGRPTHTEPCAMVDAFQVAMGLWQFTGEPRWLEDAHHIAVNAIGSTQQANGGFGLHSCSGAENSPWLELKCPEAHWCCSMRGAEGLARIAESAWFIGNDSATLAIPGDNRAVLRFRTGEIIIDQQSAYPLGGGNWLKVEATTVSAPVELRLFAPTFTKDHSVAINRQPALIEVVDGFIVLRRQWIAGDIIEWGFALKPYWGRPINRFTRTGVRTLRYGPLVIGSGGDGSSPITLPEDAPERLRVDEQGRFTCGDVLLTPVHHKMDARWTEAEKQGAVQVLFDSRSDALDRCKGERI